MATITATVDAEMARVFLTVAGATGTSGTVQRIDAAGVAASVRGGDPAVWQAGGFTGFDYEAPLDENVTYQVLDSTGNVQVTSGPVNVPSNNRTWLKNPGRPDLNLPLQVTTMPEATRDIPQGVFQVIGSKFPVVVSSQRWAEQGDLGAYTATLIERQTLLASLDLGTTLLLQTPGTYGWGSQYVSVGQETETRVSVSNGDDPRRTWTLPLTVVEAPVGLASAGVGNSWNDVMATYATWDDLQAAKASWNDLMQRVTPD